MDKDMTQTHGHVNARLPVPMVEALDKAAEASGQTRSAALREMLTLGLIKRGLWPPKASH
jgi:predicted DNA-binding protein